MNILVTLNANYIKPLKIMLKSLFINNENINFNIYLMHSNINKNELLDIENFIEINNHKLFVICIKEGYFKNAPVNMHYTKEMYYRLLAYKFLPDNMDRILYLDPDIIVINSIQKLYDIEFSDYLYAAAYHDRFSVKEINKLRLMSYDIEEYFNSGVLLMNLKRQRKEINEKKIYDFVEKNKNRLILPDQDIINSLFSKDIKKLDEILYNYDPRYYKYNKILSKGSIDMDYVIKNTCIIHFCGRKKPWNKNYSGEFLSLYKHYEKLAFKP